MSLFKDIFPPVESILDMEPEELAVFLLKYLDKRGGNLHKYNFSLGTDPEFIEYAGERKEEVMERLITAWVWLERELFLIPKPGSGGGWMIITVRGKKILESQNFNTYQKGTLLTSDNLDPILVRKVKPLFIRGDYDTAVFQAFKEVEIRVRNKAGLTNRDIGVDLMKKAFGSPGGILVDGTAHPAEQKARMELFMGTIGAFKNPSSHRDVEFSDPNEAADIIHIANQLLRIVDSIQE